MRQNSFNYSESNEIQQCVSACGAAPDEQLALWKPITIPWCLGFEL